MSNATTFLDQQLYMPLLTAQRFSHLSGLDLGVVEAQMDRRILPVVRLGKRRLVNLEALRDQARAAVPSRPQRSEDAKAQLRCASHKASDVPSNTSQTAQY
jgi:hypothetical protein